MTSTARVSRSTIWLGVFVVAAALVCVRLGIWQLDRLSQRRAYNAAVAERFTGGAETVDVALARDTGDARWRRVNGTGIPDYDREITVAARTRGGSPGVWMVTPVRLSRGASVIGDGTGGDSVTGAERDSGMVASDTLLVLVRGWVYSPNGRTVEFDRWRDGDTIRFDGIVDAFHTPLSGQMHLTSDNRAVRWLSRDSLERRWGAPVASMLVYQLGASPADTLGGYAATGGTLPARFPVPTLDEGPHKSYALQWFSFALVFVIGYAAVVWTARTRKRG